MFSIETSFLESYLDAVAQAFTAFLPLVSVTIGLFLAFAIANMMRFFIIKAAGRFR